MGVLMGGFASRLLPKAPAPLQKKEWESVVDVLDEGVVVLGENKKICYVNAAASRMFLSTRKKLFGSILQGKDPLIRKSLSVLDAACNRSLIVTDSFICESGKRAYLDLIAIPLEMGSSCLVLQDKSSEQKVLEVGRDFVANASHELKTPITIIRGFAETLQDMKVLPREIVEDILEKIIRNCQRMDTLVKNLLTLADIESAPLSSFQLCDLTVLVEECKHAVLAVYPSSQISVEQEKKVLAEVEPNILELAIMNLLDNAAKYSVDPAKISVSVKQEADLVTIAVKDEGVGIPEQDLEYIFEKFYTVNKARSRKLGGAGLGLSLAKTIIEKHDGSIQVSSHLGQGSTFKASFPRLRSF
jgi:two-component system, OmpR family, phosphate regulon sensor histidine kinase PhoR